MFFFCSLGGKPIDCCADDWAEIERECTRECWVRRKQKPPDWIGTFEYFEVLGLTLFSVHLCSVRLDSPPPPSTRTCAHSVSVSSELTTPLWGAAPCELFADWSQPRGIPDISGIRHKPGGEAGFFYFLFFIPITCRGQVMNLPTRAEGWLLGFLCLPRHEHKLNGAFAVPAYRISPNHYFKYLVVSSGLSKSTLTVQIACSSHVSIDSQGPEAS